MKTIRILCATLAVVAATTASAAGIESFVGKSPSRLLKQEQPFAKAYRAAIKDQDLPDWTQRLAVGFPAEKVELGGRTMFLVSACNPTGGCKDERFYLLYEPADKSLTGFFFLAPNTDAPGDHRMALSRWIGKVPPKERSDFLLQRALQDAQDPEKDASRLPMASPATPAH
ncbi:MAG: hypothetical protein HYU78_09325 [Rhodocyclales bacterium]|nr:hypothetical protein [Rhodocyclales bacterium]